MQTLRTSRSSVRVLTAVVIGVGLAPTLVLGFASGSTGADGAFNPTVNTRVDLPPSGVLHYTTVNIPAGVTVTFTRNTTNTPVVLLATGNVAIAGTLDVSGSASTHAGASGDANPGDDGIPGAGGPGGYEGGSGGLVPNIRGGNGLGPGGGDGGQGYYSGYYGTDPASGGGGGFGTAGGSSRSTNGGPSYGSSQLLPLVGGSGGGGGFGGTAFRGSGGGGGGGAILIASSGTLKIDGAIYANGGGAGSSAGVGCGGYGGSGSGGAIRLLATRLEGNGTLQAVGAGNASGGCGNYNQSYGGAGAAGRIHLAAEQVARTAGTNPGSTPSTTPGPVFVAGLPTLAITSVAGVAAPAAPTGNADISLPVTTPNPVTVTFATTGVPVGNTVKLTVKPANGAATSVVSPALTGTQDAATTSVQVSLPTGPSVLEATTTYTILAALGDLLGNQYARGERVEQIEVTAVPNGGSSVTLITVSGRRYPMTSPLPLMIAG